MTQAVTAEPSLPRPGELVDRYQVVTEVARGGMAAVFAVRRSAMGGFDKVLALKMVLPHLAGETQSVERFLDEARIASRIEHPNVIQVLDVGTHGGLPYLIMEFLRGQSLSAVARKAKQAGHRLSLGFRLGVLARAAEGLAAAHKTLGADGKPLGIVHRDVSPQNVHIGYSGEVKVVDFGIAAARGRLANTRSGEFRGKLAYAAPEQMKTAPVDARADVWALGVVAWELLAQKRLFRGDDDAQTIYNVLELEPESLSVLAPDLPPDVGAWVMRCLSRDAAARPSDLDDFARVLDAAALQVGGGRRGDLAAEMDQLFRGERAREDERLAAAQRGESESVPMQVEPTGGGSLTALSNDDGRGKPRRRLWPVALAGIVVAGAAIAVAVVQTRRPPAAVGVAPASATAPAPVRVRLAVPSETRLALVDGRKHDERPLSIELEPGKTAEVQLIAEDGRELDRRVSAKDDGQVLRFPPPPAPAKASAAPSAAPAKTAPRPPGPRAPATKAAGPLLADPY